MFKKYLNIIKDYFSLVDFKNKNLILFIIFNLFTNIISLFFPIVTSRIIEMLTNNKYDISLYLVCVLFLLYIFYRLFMYCDYYFYARFFQNTYIDIHRKLVNKIYSFSERYIKNISFGKIINSSSMDIINFSELPSFIFELIIQLFKLLFIVFVFFKSYFILGIFVVLVSLIYFKCSVYCNLKNAYYFRKQRDFSDKLTDMLGQILRGFKDVKSYDMSDKLDNKLDGYRKKWGNNYFLKRKFYFIKNTLVNFIEDFGQVILYVGLILFIIKSDITLSMFLILISYYDKLKDSVLSIVEDLMQINEESVSLYRVLDIINSDDINVILTGNVKNDDIFGYIEFKNVSFKYENLPILKNVSFVVKPNLVTTIVGKTGAGKTTIFNLLMRFYNTDRGNIFIDGVNINEYNDKVYFSNVTIVNQRTFMFNMSIRDNLALIDKNVDRQVNACKRVGIHNFIMSLPDQYNTLLNDGSSNLSGGQKQLLSLARALLTSSEIILLDEITSSLDPSTTKKIMNLLNDLKSDHTVLIITHNKEIMINSDELVFLDKGKVIGKGNHAELIKSNEVYKKFFSESEVK